MIFPVVPELKRKGLFCLFVDSYFYSFPITECFLIIFYVLLIRSGSKEERKDVQEGVEKRD